MQAEGKKYETVRCERGCLMMKEYYPVAKT